MKEIEELIAGARLAGACRLGAGIREPEDAVQLLFTPQGREFCLSQGYPTLEMWRDIKRTVPGLREMGIYIDEGLVELGEEARTALIGETRAFGSLSGAEEAFIVICQHGASANIGATNYAVVITERDRSSQIEVFTDSTAVHLK